ncbi:hypothetical protein C5167_023645 [Papaver somniferum]|uniref:Uncharacterized protein n=1 Tax=Papaver somniferum TaxID=3469 RepID=A0A4Y7JMW6_PAPSO|nr:hypothetical protein C5167_023645 [Papaver somniferum]
MSAYSEKDNLSAIRSDEVIRVEFRLVEDNNILGSRPPVKMDSHTIVSAPTRERAIEHMNRTLSSTVITGVPTIIQL